MVLTTIINRQINSTPRRFGNCKKSICAVMLPYLILADRYAKEMSGDRLIRFGLLFQAQLTIKMHR